MENFIFMYLIDKGTFYIDDALSFSRVLLLGNHLHIFVLEILVLLSIYLLTSSLLLGVAIACALNMVSQKINILILDHFRQLSINHCSLFVTSSSAGCVAMSRARR